jgi:hypothetical protein
VGTANDHLRVRFERGVQWLLEQYRSERARALVNKARLAAAQLLVPPEFAPRSAPSREFGPPDDREDGTHEVLAGLCGGVALRDLNLVDSLLAQLEAMEADEGDPDALARLYDWTTSPPGCAAMPRICGFSPGMTPVPRPMRPRPLST